MKEAIAGTYIYNIVFVFMAIVFALVMGTVVYYKSIKVNKIILSSIEKYEGYNTLSRNEIELNLKSIGYGVEADGKCPYKEGVPAEMPINKSAKYCVYLFKNDGKVETSDFANSNKPYYEYYRQYYHFVIPVDIQCPHFHGYGLEEEYYIFEHSTYKYCIYYKDVIANINYNNNLIRKNNNKYYSYGVLTYITMDFPFANIFIKIPIYTKSNRIFNFGNI